MVRLVYILVQKWVMFDAMHPVNACISEDKKQGHTENQVPQAIFVPTVISTTVTAHLRDKPRNSKQIEPWKCTQRGLNLELHLVLQESRVLFEFFIEEKVVRKHRA